MNGTRKDEQCLEGFLEKTEKCAWFELDRNLKQSTLAQKFSLSYHRLLIKKFNMKCFSALIAFFNILYFGN